MPSLTTDTVLMVFLSLVTLVPGVLGLLQILTTPNLTNSSDSGLGLTLTLTLRRLKVYRAALRVFLRVRLALWRTKGIPDDSPTSITIWHKTHSANAQEMWDVGTELEGVWIKAGQYLATRADVLPEPYLVKLRPLTDALPARPFEDIEKTILGEYGIGSLDEVFESVDRTPLATASIAQVHRATLLDSTPVVVKVQHRNVSEKIRQDLANLGHIVELLAAYDEEWDLRPVLHEWANELPAELDFRREADNMRDVEGAITEFQTHLASLDALPPVWTDLGLSPAALEFSVRLPRVIPDLVREKCLVLEYIDGIRLNDLAKLEDKGVDLDALSQAITRSYAFQLFTTGTFNADPHSGNFLVSPLHPSLPPSVSNPWQIILLDFGLTKRLSTDERRGLSRMLIAASEIDYAALLSSLEEIGLKLNIDDPESSMDVVRFLFRRGESREDAKRVNKERREEWEKSEAARKAADAKAGKRRKMIDAFPGCLILFGRVLNLLRGVSTHLGAKEGYLEGLTPFAKLGLVKDFESVADSERTELSTVLSRAVDKLVSERRILGLQISVLRDGKSVDGLTLAMGHMGPYDPRPFRRDTVTNVFSATKGVASTALHLLISDGACRPDDVVVRYWPSFAREGTVKAGTTIAHLLSHRAGLQDAGTREIAQDAFVMRDWSKMVSLMEEAEPDGEPGERGRYHYFSFGWLIGGLVERITGEGFMEFVSRRIFGALGWQSVEEAQMFVGIPVKGVETRLATIAWDLGEVRAMFRAEEGEEREENEDGFGVGSIEDLVERREQSENNGFPETEAERTGTESQPLLAPGDATTGKKFDLRTALRTDPRMQNALLTSNPTLFNHIRLRRAVIPSANGHFSADGLAKFYGEIGKAWNGEMTRIEGLTPELVRGMCWGCDRATWTPTEREVAGEDGTPPLRYRITDAQFNQIAKEVKEQLIGGGFMRYLFVRRLSDSELQDERTNGATHEVTIGFGHAGFGGSIGLVLPTENVSVAIVVNKLDVRGRVTRELLDAIGEELGVGRVVQFGANLTGEEGEVNAELNPFGRMV